MRVAAWQALLSNVGADAFASLRRRVDQCETEGIGILCCPEALIGGLADYSDDPFKAAIPSSDILRSLGPVTDARLTVIVGFTELTSDGRLYNSAAVVRHGTLAGVYRKRHPAIRRSVYHPGTESPIFRANGMAFGVLICYDSTFPTLGPDLASRGARVLFVPTNNALPVSRPSDGLLAEAQACDVALSAENRCWVVRADVAGVFGGLRSEGSSSITSPTGRTVSIGRPFEEDLLVAELAFGP